MIFLTNILAFPYYLAVFIRNWLFDKGVIKTIKLRSKVISIGNISVGGTGKTPFTIWLVEYLKEKGKSVVVVARPYKRRSEGSIVVSDGKTINSNTLESGDETVLVANRTNVPVVANNSKWQAALDSEKLFSPDVIIIDDGFQHRKLHRDLDIILIKEKDVRSPYIVPFGRLREPLSNYKRSDLIGFKEYHMTEYSFSFPNFEKYFVAKEDTSMIYLLGSNEAKIPEIPQRVYAVSSIANNSKFLDTVFSSGATTIESKAFPDHHIYTENDIISILSVMKSLGMGYLVTTEKDAVKLIDFKYQFDSNDIKVLVYRRDTQIIKNEDKLRDLINDIL